MFHQPESTKGKLVLFFHHPLWVKRSKKRFSYWQRPCQSFSLLIHKDVFLQYDNEGWQMLKGKSPPTEIEQLQDMKCLMSIL